MMNTTLPHQGMLPWRYGNHDNECPTHFSCAFRRRVLDSRRHSLLSSPVAYGWPVPEPQRRQEG